MPMRTLVQAQPAVAAPQHTITKQQTHRTTRVLLVEDEPLTAEVFNGCEHDVAVGYFKAAGFGSSKTLTVISGFVSKSEFASQVHGGLGRSCTNQSQCSDSYEGFFHFRFLQG